LLNTKADKSSEVLHGYSHFSLIDEEVQKVGLFVVNTLLVRIRSENYKIKYGSWGREAMDKCWERAEELANNGLEVDNTEYFVHKRIGVRLIDGTQTHYLVKHGMVTENYCPKGRMVGAVLRLKMNTLGHIPMPIQMEAERMFDAYYKNFRFVRFHDDTEEDMEDHD